MTGKKRAFIMRQVAIQSVTVNALILVLDIVVLAFYSLLQDFVFATLLADLLELLLLLEAGILLLGGGAYVLTSGVFFGKVREQVFHSEGWSPEEYRRSEVRALPFIVAGALVLAESLLLALV